MNTTENNKLIAEFMGAKEVRKDNFKFPNRTGLPLQIGTINYHSDWNWLMEVVDKCSKTACDLGNTAELELKLEMWMFLTQELTSVYCACVEFIKWYNQQNK